MLGRVRCDPNAPFEAVFGSQLVTVWLNTRCHLPSWTTTVTAAPLGTLVRVKLPSMAVDAEAYAGGVVQPQTGNAVLMPVVGVWTAPIGT